MKFTFMLYLCLSNHFLRISAQSSDFEAEHRYGSNEQLGSATTESIDDDTIEFDHTNLKSFALQVMQVQDVTASMIDDFLNVNADGFVDGLLSELRAKYGAVEYGLSSFSDKPLPVVGYGTYGQWWNEETTKELGLVEDYCYRLDQTLTQSDDELKAAFASLTIRSGKDFMENQWDAMFRTGVDPDIPWMASEGYDDLADVIKIAMLVSDGPAHTAYFNQGIIGRRNLAHERYYLGGPYNGPLNPDLQNCSLVNTYRAGLDNTANTDWLPYPEILSREGSSSDPCFGWMTTASMSKRSVLGTLMWYIYGYGYDTFDRLPIAFECVDPTNVTTSCGKYSAFISCCTMWGVSRERCDDVPAYNDAFPDFDACMEYGGNYARCHRTLDGYQFSKDEDLMERYSACARREDDPEQEHWNIAQTKEPSYEFWDGLNIFDEFPVRSEADKVALFENFQNMPTYSDASLNDDCARYEYPRLVDSQMMLRRQIALVVAWSPTNQILKSLDGGNELDNYDEQALQWSAEVCPGMKWDPWTKYVCDPSNDRMYACPLPDNKDSYDYDPYDPESVSDPDWDDETGWWLADYVYTSDIEYQWWNKCIEREYSSHLKSMDSILAESSYYVGPPQDTTELLDRILQAIQKAADTWIQRTNSDDFVASDTISGNSERERQTSKSDVLGRILEPIYVQPIIVTTTTTTTLITTTVLVTETQTVSTVDTPNTTDNNILPTVSITNAMPTAMVTETDSISTVISSSSPGTTTGESNAGMIISTSIGSVLVIGGGSAVLVASGIRRRTSRSEDTEVSTRLNERDRQISVGRDGFS